MKEKLISQFHWIIIIYAAFNVYTLQEEKLIEIEAAKQEIPRLQGKIDKQKIKLDGIEEFRKNLAASEERVKEVVKKIETIQKQLPTNINDTEVQGSVKEISQTLKIRDPQVVAENEVNRGFYFAKDYKFTGTGTFLQFLILMEKLEVMASNDRILNVKSLSLSVTDSLAENDKKSRFQLLNFEAKIESFRYNPNYDVREQK